MENGKLKIFSDAAGRVPIRYFPNPPGSLHGRSQGVVVGSFRHSMGCYRHPTLRAAGCRPYSPSGKLVLFIIPVLSPTCVTPHQSILPVPRSRQYCQLPPGGSQGVVVGSFRHSIGCYRHPTLRAAGCRPYRAGKSFAPIKTFNLPLSPFQFAPIGSPLCGGANWV